MTLERGGSGVGWRHAERPLEPPKDCAWTTAPDAFLGSWAIDGAGWSLEGAFTSPSPAATDFWWRVVSLIDEPERDCSYRAPASWTRTP